MFRKIKYLLVLIIIPILTSCLPRHTSLAFNNMNSFAQKMYAEKNMKMWGIGGGFLDDVNKFDMNFISYKDFNLNEARKFYIGVSESFLSQINADEKIRPYLRQYPFLIDNVKLMIAFEKKNGDRVDPPNIALICIGFNDKEKQTYVFYAVYENGKYSTYHTETYEEAKKIVQSQIK